MPPEKKNDDEGFATPPAPLEDSVASTRADRYEDLRRHALGGAPVTGGGLGLTLFLRKGMAAWMEAWRCCASRGEQGSPDAPSLADRVPLPVQTELVTILAAMAWHSVQEMMQ